MQGRCSRQGNTICVGKKLQDLHASKRTITSNYDPYRRRLAQATLVSLFFLYHLIIITTKLILFCTVFVNIKVTNNGNKNCKGKTCYIILIIKFTINKINCYSHCILLNKHVKQPLNSCKQPIITLIIAIHTSTCPLIMLLTPITYLLGSYTNRDTKYYLLNL